MFMLYLCVFIIIVLGTLQNILPILAGYTATPEGQIFLGTIHHPDDYFYYLSQFAQGSDSWGLARNLYTHDMADPTIVGWINVWMGKIGAVFGATAIQSYHASVIVLTIVFLLVVFILMKELSKGLMHARLIALLGFFLFVASNAFSLPSTEAGVLVFKPVTYWFNFGIPGQRLGGVPHHLFMHTVLALSFIVLNKLLKETMSIRRLALFSIALSVSGAVLASIQPLHWILVSCAAGFGGLHNMFTLIFRKKPFAASMHRLFWPAFLLFTSGFLPAMRLQQLFSTVPFSQLPKWEFANSVFVDVKTFLLGYGPVFLLGCIAVFILRKRVLRLPIFLLASYTVLSIVLFFSPVPSIVHLQNVRFLSSITIAGVSFLAGYGIITASKAVRRLQYVFVGIVVLIVIVSTFPAHYTSIVQATKTDTNNAYVYLDKKVIEGMREARRVSDPDDIFAVMWPYHKSFPAIAVRTVYYGHPLLTTNSEEKGKENYHFFSNIKTVEEKRLFLKRERIRFVVAEPWAMDLLNLPELNIVYNNGSIVIAKVY